ncbi:hypothetical protein FPV67DRAFT_1787111 [Lyophyllum atratum]|nr:hypothetical protein FPV67DRAFT_1787111 [Lyophyllum atratum]
MPNSSPPATATALSLYTKRLTGDRPTCVPPEASFIDKAKQELIFYWSEDSSLGHPFQISVLNLKTGRWKNTTKHYLCLEKPWSPLSPETKKPLPRHAQSAAALCKLEGHRIIILFGGLDITENPTSDMYMIDIDRHRWWKVDVPENVVPRVDHEMVSIENRLYIFGGLPGHDSYSVVEFNPFNLSWSWPVIDRPYPDDLRRVLVWSAGVVPIHGGREILFLPGISDDPENGNFAATHIVKYNIIKQTFTVSKTIGGILPVDMEGYDDLLLTSTGSLKQLGASIKLEEGSTADTCSVLVATWDKYFPDDNKRPSPELWLFTLSTTKPSMCDRLDKLEERLKELNLSFVTSAVLTDQAILLLGCREEPAEDDLHEFNICVEIGLHDGVRHTQRS